MELTRIQDVFNDIGFDLFRNYPYKSHRFLFKVVHPPTKIDCNATIKLNRAEFSMSSKSLQSTLSINHLETSFEATLRSTCLFEGFVASLFVCTALEKAQVTVSQVRSRV